MGARRFHRPFPPFRLEQKQPFSVTLLRTGLPVDPRFSQKEPVMVLFRPSASCQASHHHESFPDLFMCHVLILHEVADYPEWKRIFDAAAGIRKEAGEVSFQVLRYENEPRKIVHFSVWISSAAARAFFESPRLVKIREEAGVKSPEFLYLEELEAGVL